MIAYVENVQKSWPSWRGANTNNPALIAGMVATLRAAIPGSAPDVCLTGHSGGGSFTFGFINAFDAIPTYITRIAFLDSNYSFFLGDVYTSGLLPQDDFKEAFLHFSIAANQGNAQAQSALAGMYRDGEGVDRDDQRAFFWREKAAKQRGPCDQRQLGRMYEHGVGVEQDHQAAAFWYRKAADQGGYFERSQITDLQKAVIGHSGGWCKRNTDQSDQ